MELSLIAFCLEVKKIPLPRGEKGILNGLNCSVGIIFF